MNVHKNARSIPASRALLIHRVEREGLSVKAAADKIGLSDRRGREWIRRHRASEPLTDRSSRPHRSRSVPVATRNAVIDLRRGLKLTIVRIAELTGISCSSVARICRAEGMSRLQFIDPAPPPPIVRYERERPGELLHLDTKKLGRFTEVGHRITKKRTYGKGGGWEVLHLAIDDASRVSYAEILPDQLGSTTTAFFRRAVDWFAMHGVSVEEAMTDNGSPYKSRLFAAACREFHVKHRRTRPYTPRTNGKAERMIQTLLREWAYRFTYQNSDQRKHWLEPYLHFYNVHRRHSSLKSKPPISRLERNNVLTLDS